MAAMAAANFHYQPRGSDGEQEQDNEEAAHGDTLNSPPQPLHHLHSIQGIALNSGLTNGASVGSGGLSHLSRYVSASNASNLDNHHHDKSDDSAIENSPAASAASGGHGQHSPVSSKKSQHQCSSISVNPSDPMGVSGVSSLLEALRLLSDLRIRLIPNGKCTFFSPTVCSFQ